MIIYLLMQHYDYDHTEVLSAFLKEQSAKDEMAKKIEESRPYNLLSPESHGIFIQEVEVIE